jgi:hypothetical protein
LLLQTLASAPDVRIVLERRFDMMNWFKRHGYPNSLWEQQQAAAPAAVPPKAAAAAAVPAAAQPADAQVLVDDSMVHDDKHKERCLLVFDFDKTLTDWDAGAQHGQAARDCEVTPIMCTSSHAPVCPAKCCTPLLLMTQSCYML